MNQPIRRVASKAVLLAKDNVDTDQICPARFLTTTSKDGFGDALFADWRFDRDGRPRADFTLDRPDRRDRSILVAGRNFGCGSSREHAVWALRDFGFRVVVAPSMADIFRRNALKNGVVPVVIGDAAHRALVEILTAVPETTVTVDVEAMTLTAERVTTEFQLELFARRCLIEGVDELGFLLSRLAEIETFERTRAAF